jgi:hypothetical protein
MAIAIPIAALAFTAIGTGVAVDSSVQSANAQKASSDYNAQVAMNNAKLASSNAEVAGAQGDLAAQKQYQLSTQQQGALRAAQAANGIELDSGSPLAVQGDLARTGQQNVQATQYNADVDSTNYLDQQLDYTSTAGMDTATGQNDATAGGLSAGSSIIGGASSVSSKWASYQQSGAL